ncbi:unnamed protein product [Auanema sp. JU1783]|nr:unnamed protein product [Auanema sp. JU1783]
MHSGLPSQGSILRIPSNLKTTSANTPEVLVRFFNVTSRDVDLIWINQKGFGIRYAKLAKSRHIDIRTFEGHYWILRESGTGTPLLAQIYFSPTTWEKFEVYTPARRDPANPRVVCRTSVFVRSPERTLADLCIRTVLKHNSNVDAVAQLPLPGNLITILLEAAYHTHFYQRYFNIFPDIVARTAALPREDPEVLMITDAEVIDYSRMTPPEKKTKKLTNNVEAKKIKELVEEALQKDDTKARWEAIKLLRQQGHLHEIAKVYVQLISDNDLIELSDEDMLQLDDYFSLMTSNTASSYYKLLTDAVDKHNDNVKKLGNIVRLLSYMILKVDLVSNVAFTELLSNDLITLIHDRIPYFTGKEGKETLFKYVKKDSAEVNIMRFMLKMKSPVVSRNPRIKFNVDNPVTSTYANSNSIKISMKMGAVYRNVVESTQNEQLDLELELYLMTALTHMKRNDRVEMLKEYYAEEDYRKVTKFVRDILMGDVPVPAKEVAVVIRRAYAIFSTVCPSFELPDYNMNDLVNWKSIALLYRCDPNLLSAFVHRTKTNLLFDLLETYDKIEDSNIVAPLVGALLNKAMIEADHEKFTVYCHRVAELGIKNKDMLQFLTKVVEVSAGTKAEYSLLALVLCVASTMKLSESNIVGHKHMTNFLVACIKLCPKTLLKNQCALFGSLITKHFKNAYMAINNQETSEKDADILRYGCSKLAEFLACNEKPVKRIVSFIISEVLMTAKSMELAFAKLHGICDTHSKALLAVALPPAEKKQYARLSKTLKRVYKPTV